MSWKRHFTTYSGTQSPIPGNKRKELDNGRDNASRFQSWLPEVYVGQPNRLERYLQYDSMDQDSEINTALDTISEFSTQESEKTDTPFEIKWTNEPTESESDIVLAVLKQWSRVNEWNRRLFTTFRNAIKYGDQVFIRDPETWKLYYVNQRDVIKVIVDEANGKKPVQYVIKNIDPNFSTLVATSNSQSLGVTGFKTPAGSKIAGQANISQGIGSDIEHVIDASHVIHVAMTDGMDSSWPFGNSILDPVYKTYKQKELLEDSIIIYRVQRAPERRIFYIDVGDMPPHQAMAHVKRVKEEIHQRRIPTRGGGGNSMMDAQYNPLCLAMDTEIPLLDGRTLTISQLAEEYQKGIENWTYSCDPITGKIVPGNITWAGVTRKNAKVIKLHLNDGSSITVTPDHKIPVLGKGFVEAQYLTENDSLISFKTRERKLSSSSGDQTYTQIYDHEKNDWVYAHRMVGTFFRDINKHQEFTYLPENCGAHKNVIHHKDFNRYNNDPRNLQWMNQDDYIKYHSDQNMWKHLDESEAQLIKDKISSSVKHLRATGVYDIQKARQKAAWSGQNDLSARVSSARNASTNQEKNYTFDQLQAIYDLAVKHDFKLKSMLADTEGHDFVLKTVRESSKPVTGKNVSIKVDRLTHQDVYDTIRHFGYKNWADFKSKRHEFNHRLVRIEWLDETQDVGTVTIDGQERWHNYHTFPVNNSIFVKNSIMEDYFFAQCLSLDTKIPLLDGRTLTLEEIIAEYQDGKTNYVYGLSNKTFEFEPAKIKWAGVTRKNAQVLKITLDNNESVIATPDHLFITRDGDEVQAQDLTVGESLMPIVVINKSQKLDWKNNIRNYYSSDGTIKGSNHNDNQDVFDSSLKMNKDMVENMIMCFDNGFTTVEQLKEKLPSYIPFISSWQEENGSQDIIVNEQILDQMVNIIGFRNFDEWKKYYQGEDVVERENHKIISIEWLEERQDTGDITIESESESHWFGLSAGIFVHNSAEGRGSKVETLPGGQNLGEIDDLKFFNNKLARGLRIPSSYLPTGPDDGTATFNDGRVGTAYIQEYRFTQYCRRLQRMISEVFDKEFKMFLKYKGYEIDTSQFYIDFVEPQSFSSYREIEINSARVNVFGQIEGVDYISKRFALKKYLQLSDEEIFENEKLWKEENPSKVSKAINDEEFSDLSKVGNMGGFDGGLDDFTDDGEDLDDIDLDNATEGPESESSPISGEESSEEE